MNRSTWTAVLVTVTLLVGATCSTYLPWGGVARRAAPTVAALRDWAVERQFVFAAGAPHRMPPAAAVATVASGAIGAAAAVAAAVVAFVAWRAGRRRPRAVVLRLARRGGAVADIARASGLSQDAVRLLLTPQLHPGGRRAAADGRAGASRAWTEASPARPGGTVFRGAPASFAAALQRAERTDAASR